MMISMMLMVMGLVMIMMMMMMMVFNVMTMKIASIVKNICCEYAHDVDDGQNDADDEYWHDDYC